MTNHKQLADRILRILGGATYESASLGVTVYQVPGITGMDAQLFVKHPAVAMAMMEKCSEVNINCHLDQDMIPTVTARSWHGKEATARNRSRPLAINMACVEALDD